MSGRIFETDLPLRFGDADPAGILYYPRLLHFCHVAMEELFLAITGRSYAVLLSERKVGFPTVHLNVTYHSAIHYGTTLRMQLTVTKLGRRSLTFRYREMGGQGAPRAEVLGTVVCVDMDSWSSIVIPDDLRVSLESYLEQVDDA